MTIRAPTFDKIEEIGVFAFRRPPLREEYLGAGPWFSHAHVGGVVKRRGNRCVLSPLHTLPRPPHRPVPAGKWVADPQLTAPIRSSVPMSQIEALCRFPGPCADA